jgi:hypothetical protein
MVCPELKTSSETSKKAQVYLEQPGFSLPVIQYKHVIPALEAATDLNTLLQIAAFHESQISPVPRGCLDASPEAHA